MPELEARRRRCAEFQDALARLRAALAARRPRRPRPGPPARRALSSPTACPRPPNARHPDRGAQLRCAVAVVRASGAFDAEGYAEANRLATRRVDPLQHFVDEGWRDLRAPSLEFDLWWYTCTYLDPTAEDVNPLLHYLLVGRHAGLEPVPGPPPERVPTDYDGRTAASGLPVRGLRPRRHRRRLRRALPARAEPVQRRLLPRRRRPRARRARQARGSRRRERGASRTRPTTSAPGRCWPATWSAGTGWTATTR